MRPVGILRVLTDRERLAVAGSLAVGPATTDELAERTQIDRRRVVVVLGDLRAAGLVTLVDSVYALDLAELRRVAQAAADTELPMDPVIGFGMTDDERLVLERLFSGRTLVEYPSGRPKQQIVLRRLALEFDVGRRYTEDEVNDVLRAFFNDYPLLRRGLIDEQLLDREHRDGVTVYWRSGGRVLF